MIDALLSWVPWLLGILAATGAGAGVLFAVFPSLLTGAVLPFLLGTPLGRKLAIGLLVLVGLLLVVWRIYGAGRAAEKARQAEATLRNLKTRMEVDNEIASLSRDQRRARLNRWVRDDAE